MANPNPIVSLRDAQGLYQLTGNIAYLFTYGYWTGGGYSAGVVSPSFVPYTPAERDFGTFDNFDAVSKVHDLAFAAAQQGLVIDLASGVTPTTAVVSYYQTLLAADQQFVRDASATTASTAWGEDVRLGAISTMATRAQSDQLLIERYQDPTDVLGGNTTAGVNAQLSQIKQLSELMDQYSATSSSEKPDVTNLAMLKGQIADLANSIDVLRANTDSFSQVGVAEWASNPGAYGSEAKLAGQLILAFANGGLGLNDAANREIQDSNNQLNQYLLDAIGSRGGQIIQSGTSTLQSGLTAYGQDAVQQAQAQLDGTNAMVSAIREAWSEAGNLLGTGATAVGQAAGNIASYFFNNILTSPAEGAQPSAQAASFQDSLPPASFTPALPSYNDFATSAMASFPPGNSQYNSGSYNDYSTPQGWSPYDSSPFNPWGNYSTGGYGGYVGDGYNGGNDYSPSYYGGDYYSPSYYGGDYYSPSYYGGDYYSPSYYGGDGYYEGGYYSPSYYTPSYYGGDGYGYGGYGYGGYSYGGYSYGGYSYGGYSYGGYGYGYGYGGDGGDDGFGIPPIILDLTGNGIHITPLSSSNMFMDMANDGHEQRTAWAGAGNGVLVYDPTGGAITQANQVEFTLWDPSAKTDMQAIEDVFDTNHDGTLNSSDASWSSFRILVTNADGTTTLETLAQAGVTSINLTPNDYQQTLPDGSSIDGETTFTRSNGTIGTAAAATFAAAGSDYSVQQTVTHGADGSTTIANSAYGLDGSLAEKIVTTTSANGLSRTITYDWNGDGVVDQTETDVTMVNADGSTTETLRDVNGAGVLMDRTTTVTSANGSMVTISRDTTGAGYVDQQEVDATNADGSTSVTVSDLTRNGSLIDQTVSTVSASGLTRTVATDSTGSGYADTIESDQTVVAANGTRTETETVSNADSSLRSRTVTTTAANELSTTTQTDAAGSGIYSETVTDTTVVNGDGSRTTTSLNQAANGTVTGRTVTTVSADGNTTTTQTDQAGSGTFNATETDGIAFDAAGSRTETVTQEAASGAIYEKQVSLRNADGLTGSVQTYENTGFGLALTESDIKTVNTAGGLVETVIQYAADGAVTGETISTTSADGLTQSTQQDPSGAGVFDFLTTTTTVKNAAGASVTTETRTAANGTRIGQTVATASADGTSTITQEDSTGSGTYDTTVADTKTQNADGSVTKIVTTTSANGTLLGRQTTLSSADRTTVTATTADGDGETVEIESTVTVADGTVTDTVVDYAPNGKLVDETVTITSANGLSTTTETDANGASSSFNLTTTDVTALNANGSRTRTVTDTSANGAVIDRTVMTTSANGLASVQTTSVDGKIDYTTTDATVLNIDGSQTKTVRKASASGALIDATVTTTSGNGLSVVTGTDLNGDGVSDRTSTDVTVLSADGSTTETVSDVEGTSGTLLDRTVTTTSASGASKTIDQDQAGRGFFDQVETVVTGTDGSVSDTVAKDGSTGQLLDETVTTTSANGLVVTTATDLNGDGVFDKVQTATTSYGLDGSKTVATSLRSGTAVTQTTVTTTSANGLATTTAVYGQAGVAQSASTDVKTLNADGSTTETVSQYSGIGTLTARTTTTTSSDGKTTTVQTSADGGPQNSGVATTAEQLDGSVVVTTSAYAAGGVLSGKTVRTTAANKLSWAETVDANGDGTVDDTQSDAIVLNVDGSTTETFIDARANGASATTLVTTKSGNGLSETVATTGSIKSVADSNTLTDATTINNDGSTTETRTIVNGSGVAWSKETVQTSANGLSKTTSLSEASDTVTDYTDQLVTNTDGSSTETTKILDRNGSAFETDVLTTGANGLSNSLQSARNGSATYNHFETKAVNADGSTTDTVWDTNGSGTTTDEVVTTTSGNGLAKQVQVLPAGTSVAISITNVTTPNADGSTTEVISKLGGTGELLWRQMQTTSDDGLTVTTALDVNGDGVIDETTTDVTVINQDGSRTETATTVYASGTQKSQTVTTTSANGLVVTTQTTIAGYESITEVNSTASNGVQTETASHFTATGTLASSTTTAVSADGSSKVITSRDASGNVTQVTTTTIQTDANGSYNWVLQNASGTTLDQATHVIDANGVDHVTLSIGSQSFQATLNLAQEAAVQAQVSRLFDTLLGRAPSAAESELALQYYSASGFNLASMTSNMLSSSEFTTKYGTLTNLEFVEQIYQNALGRNASLGELSGWLAQFSAGSITRASLADTVSESAEHVASGNVYQETNDSYSPNGTWSLSHTIDTAQANTIVGNLYLATLGRVADSTGLSTYSNDLLNGTLTVAGIASALLGTSEFATNFGSLTTTAFVSDVFVNTLGRPPSQAEQQYWAGALSGGIVSKADFALAVALSPDGGSVIDNGNGTEQRFVYDSDPSGNWAYTDQLWQKATTASSTQSVSSDDWIAKSTTTSEQVWVSSGYYTSDESGTYWVDTSGYQTEQFTTTSMIQQVDGHTHTVVTQHDSAELSVTTVNNNGTSTTTPVSNSPGDQPWTTIVQTYENGNLLDTITTSDNGTRSIAISRATGADVLATSGTDTVTFASNISYNQLWFNRSGNDLVISVIGQSETMTLSSWFLGTADQPASIVTGDGYTLTAAGIQSLVQSQASQVIPMSGTNSLALVTAPTLALAADTGLLSTDKITLNGQVKVSGLASGAGWQYSLDGGTTWVAGNGTSIAASVFGADGAKTVEVRQMDSRGNYSPVGSLGFTLDTAVGAPTLALANDTSGGQAITSNGLVNVFGLAVGASWQYSLNNGQTWTSGSGTTFSVSGADGTKSVLVCQTDVAGNVSAAANLAFTLDTSVAAVGLALAQDTSNGHGVTSNAQINLTGLASGATWQYSLDGGQSWTTGAGTSISAQAFGADGAKSVEVRQTDLAGNVSTVANLSFTLATAAAVPVIALVQDTSDGQNITSDGQIDLSDLAAGGTWQYSLNGGQTWLTGSGTSLASGALGSDGAKTILIRQTDAAGNVSAAASLSFTLDTSASALTLVLAADTGSSSTDKITANGQVNIAGLANGATWQYSLNGGTTCVAGTGTSIAASALGADGAKTLEVHQIDIAGNISPIATLVFTLDTTAAAPVLSLAQDTSGGRLATSNGQVSVSGLGAGATWQYSLDGGNTWITGTGTSIAASAFGIDGLKSVQVRQTDVAGNTSSASSLLFALAQGTPVYNAAGQATGETINNSNGTQDRIAFNTSGSGNWAYTDQLWQKATTTSATQSVSSDDWVSKSTTTSEQVWVSSGYYTSDESGTYWVDTSGYQTEQVTTTSMVQQVDGHTHTVVTQHDSVEQSVTTFSNNGTSTTTAVSNSQGDQPWTTIVQTYESGNLLDTITTYDNGTRAIAISRATGADVLAVSGTDAVTFASNISYNQLWFNRSGNDLVISVIGQSETMTLSGWFLGAADQPASIVTGDGYTLTVAGIQSLVQAMAAQAIPMSGTNGAAFIASPTLALAADTGASSTDKITANGQVNVSGLASGATWQYSLTGGTSWVTGTGTAIAASVFVSGGANTVQVRQTNANGNVSAVASLSFVLETAAAAPTLALIADTGASSTDLITANGQVGVFGLTSGATWKYSLNNGATWVTGTGTSIAASAFGADGNKTVQVQQTDVAGNVSPITSFSFTLDTSAAAPVLALAVDTGSSSSDGITNNGRVNVSLASGATWQYSLNGGTSWLNGTGSSIAASAFGADGAKNVEVRQTDIAGNTSPIASLSFTLDTAPPTAPSLVLAADTGSSASDDITSNAQVDVLGLVSGGTWQYSLNGGAGWTAGTGTSIAALAFGSIGAKTVEVEQVDIAGNVSSVASLGFTLTAPLAPTTALSLSGSAASLALSGLETGASWQYQVDGGSWQTGTGTSVALTVGTHSWSVEQADIAGNASPVDVAGNFIVGTSAMGQTLTGVGAGDTFVIGRNGGSDTINAAAGTGSDTLALGPTINHDQLWFSQSASNLTIGVIGQSETLTVAGWYSSANDQLNEIETSDGYSINASGVQAMVQAMASFNPPAAGQTTLPTATAASLSPAMAANWHHP